MNIIQAVKNTKAKLVFEDKWLLYEDGNYKVFQKKIDSKIIKKLIDTLNQDDAVSVLLIKE